MTADYTATQLQAAYDRAYADVRKEYAEDLPALLASVNCQSVEELVRSYRNTVAWAKSYGLPVSSVPNAHADTARHTRDALATLWLPPGEIVGLAQRAAATGCLSEDGCHWLRRIEIERQRQKRESPAVQGEAVG